MLLLSKQLCDIKTFKVHLVQHQFRISHYPLLTHLYYNRNQREKNTTSQHLVTAFYVQDIVENALHILFPLPLSLPIVQKQLLEGWDFASPATVHQGMAMNFIRQVWAVQSFFPLSGTKINNSLQALLPPDPLFFPVINDVFPSQSLGDTWEPQSCLSPGIPSPSCPLAPTVCDPQLQLLTCFAAICISAFAFQIS